MTNPPDQTQLIKLLADKDGALLANVAAYVQAAYSGDEAAWLLELAGYNPEKQTDRQRHRALARLLCAAHRRGDPIAAALIADRPMRKSEIEALFPAAR